MKILIVHNKYQQPGGEDHVFNAESELLTEHGHFVRKLLFENSNLKSWLDVILLGFKILYNPTSAKEVEKIIVTLQPDIIHVHNFTPIASPAIFFVASKYHIPVVLTLHNYRLICPSATLFFKGKIYENSLHTRFPFDAVRRGVYRNSMLQTAAIACMTSFHNSIGTWRNKVDRFIVLSEFAKNKILESTLNIDESQLAIKSNFMTDVGRGQLIRDNYFLFIGRLTEEKGICTLLKAAAKGRFKLEIIGEGPLRKVVENFASHHENIRFSGYQNKQIVIEYLKRCRALIFPSEWYEGFPMTIVEAFSTGTPVIASRLGSMKEIIQHKFNGLHFEPGNKYDLVGKVNMMAVDKKLRMDLSENARTTYEKLYTPERNYEALMGIYESAKNNKHFTSPSVCLNKTLPAA